MINERAGEVASETVKNIPAMGTVALTLFGLPIADWVQLAVLLYTLLQMHVLAKKNLGFYQSLLSWLREVFRVKRSKGK